MLFIAKKHVPKKLIFCSILIYFPIKQHLNNHLQRTLFNAIIQNEKLHLLATCSYLPKSFTYNVLLQSKNLNKRLLLVFLT